MTETSKNPKPATAGATASLARFKLPGWTVSLWEWFRGLPGWFQSGAYAAIVAGFLGFIFFLGFVSGERAVGPAYPLFAKVTNKLDWMFFRGGPVPKLDATIYNSALVRLNSTVGIVDTGRPDTDQNALSQNGGGLTSFGDDLLLLAYNGKIYAATSSDDIRDTGLAAPDNNREDYQALQQNPDFDQYTFHRGYLRYNDLMFVDAPSGKALIASYTEFHPGQACYTNTLAKLALPAGTTDIDDIEATGEDWDILFRTDPCMTFKVEHLAMEGHMAGGRMVFDGERTIYMTSGDFHLDGMRSSGPGIAQDPDAMYGKTLQIDLVTGEGEINSTGHRNAQGIAMSAEGQLLIAEHGPRGGDELNIIEQGLNYGWPLESYGTTYRGTPIPNSISYGRHTQFEPPIHSWIPSVAISGMTRVEGFDPSWDGDLLVSSLSDQALYRIRLEHDRAVYSERIEIGSRIRYVHQHTSGDIVLWTDNSELIFLSALERVDEGLRFQTWLETAELPNRVKADLNTVMDRCVECHSFQVGDDEKAPGSNKIFGKETATTQYAGYSEGLMDKSGRWTRENLIAYLDDPQGFAPGSIMPAANIDDPRVAEALVDYLEFLERQF
ncbi:MAG: PQQ-dependent sugar dehydrogenase [Pseudomonadota bacterium]